MVRAQSAKEPVDFIFGRTYPEPLQSGTRTDIQYRCGVQYFCSPTFPAHDVKQLKGALHHAHVERVLIGQAGNSALWG